MYGKFYADLTYLLANGMNLLDVSSIEGLYYFFIPLFICF